MQMKSMRAQLKDVSKELAQLAKHVDRIAVQAKKTGQKKKTPAKAAAKKKGHGAAAGEKIAAKTATLLDSVYGVIKKSRNGVAIATLKAKTRLGPRQLSNALYKLSQKGKIEAKSRGLYFKKSQ
jgi:hypothetical protein